MNKIEFPDYGHRFSTILVDPPWRMTDRGVNARPKAWNAITSSYPRDGDEHLYQTMSLDELRALPVPDLATTQAHLWMWSLNGTVEQAYRLIRSWRFQPMGPLTWVKTGKKGKLVYGMGVYYRMNTEQLLFATRGEPALIPPTPWLGSAFMAPRQEHSRKPDIQYDIVETVSPGPYIELFARRPREGWTSWGNELV